MLEDYFSIKINESGQIETLPMISEMFKPYPQEIPNLVLRLASEPNFTIEEDFICKIAVELSHYYAKFLDVYSTKVELASL